MEALSAVMAVLSKTPRLARCLTLRTLLKEQDSMDAFFQHSHTCTKAQQGKLQILRKMDSEYPFLEYYAVDSRLLASSTSRAQTVSRSVDLGIIQHHQEATMSALHQYEDSIGKLAIFGIVVLFQACSCDLFPPHRSCVPMKSFLPAKEPQYLCSRHCILLRKTLFGHERKMQEINHCLEFKERILCCKHVQETTETYLQSEAGQQLLYKHVRKRMEQVVQIEDQLLKLSAMKRHFFHKCKRTAKKFSEKEQKLTEREQRTLKALYSKKKQLLCSAELLAGWEKETVLSEIENVNNQVEEMKLSVEKEELEEVKQKRVLKHCDMMIQELWGKLSLSPTEKQEVVNSSLNWADKFMDKKTIGFHLNPTILAEAELKRNLFDRLRFWINREIMQRSKYLELATLLQVSLTKSFLRTQLNQEITKIKIRWIKVKAMQRRCLLGKKRDVLHRWLNKTICEKRKQISYQKDKQQKRFLKVAQRAIQAHQRKIERAKWKENYDPLYEKRIWIHEETGYCMYSEPSS